MSTRKTNLKESTTTNQVDYVLVYERGSDEPKKMSKATFDAQYATSAAEPAYTKYVAILNQSSTNAPTQEIVENTIGGTISWSYDSVGRYTGTLAGAFPVGNTFMFISRAGDESSFAAGSVTLFSFGFNDADSFYLNTARIATATGVITLENGWLYNTLIEIRVYP